MDRSRRLPSGVESRRFENWEFAYALLLGVGVAARYANWLGIDVISGRAIDLAALTRTLLAELDGVRLLDRGVRLRAIVTLEFPNTEPQALLETLRHERINAGLSFRHYATIDFAE